MAGAERKTRTAGSPATSSRWNATTVLLPSPARAREARARAGEGKSTVVAFQRDEVAGEPAVRVFLSAPAIPARLLVFGATDLTAAVASLGTFAGYHVTVCDARPVFATPGRFQDAAE